MYTSFVMTGISGINRNIVECKERKISDIGNRIIVLIETLWNVKYVIKTETRREQAVLIETLWNVKFFDPVPVLK